jgi:hypothetical protein
MSQVNWMRCQGNQWCPLLTVDLDHEAFDVGGVYVIPVASRQDVLEASTGCLTKDVLESSRQE